ncbi:hypothetical protein RRG08_058717 [Elysia crispata]|uniref:Uncharacterized protein n=1 Tax=Elysia crispata TaxID=231223 RepID=A0AAE1D5W4_9GAST|nr:hypothetical protein RRG08_058717 [Elysia crispata]
MGLPAVLPGVERSSPPSGGPELRTGRDDRAWRSHSAHLWSSTERNQGPSIKAGEGSGFMPVRFYSGLVPYRSGSIQVQFHTGPVPFRSGFLPVRFHTGPVPYMCGSIQVRIHTGAVPFRSGSIQMRFHSGPVPYKCGSIKVTNEKTLYTALLLMINQSRALSTGRHAASTPTQLLFFDSCRSSNPEDFLWRLRLV